MTRIPTARAWARLAVFTAATTLLVGPGAPVALAAARVVFDQTSVDLGTVELGESVSVDFTFRNTGDEPLQITAVRPQCGCTVADFTPEVAPGESGTIHAEVHTNSLHAGKVSKTITVNTTAPGGERVILEIRMNLSTAVELLPRPTVFLRTRPGTERTEQVLARPNRKGMRITGVRSTNPVIRATIEPAEPSTGAGGKGSGGLASALLPREGDVWVSVTVPADAEPGVHRADVIVETSDPEHPEAVIKVNAVVR